MHRISGSDEPVPPARAPDSPTAMPAGDQVPSATDTLLHRLQAGDRDAAAAFVMRNAAKIRRRIRSRLTYSARRIVDSDDLLLTVCRRLDEIVLKRTLSASSPGELWSLVDRLVINAASDYAHSSVRSHPQGARTQPEARPALPEPSPPPDAEQTTSDLRMSDLDGVDHGVLRMRMDGRTYAQIATATGLSTSAARKRWERMRRRLYALLKATGRFAFGAGPDRR